MASPRRIVLMVEGPADRDAAPVLVRMLLSRLPEPPRDTVVPDDQPPFMVGEIGGLIGRDKKSNAVRYDQWVNYLERARRTRKNLGGVLLVLDGDIKRVAGQPFCPGAVGRMLAEASRQAGGGSLFSVAVVFLRAEYESLFIASRESLPGMKAEPPPAPPDVEARRDAKDWLADALSEGYANTADQERLTHHLDFDLIRSRMSSFGRLERAVAGLVGAIRAGTHVVSPHTPLPPPPA